MAGGDPDAQQPDAGLTACREALAPVIRELLNQGIPANAIVRTLAELSVMTVDRERQH